MPTQQFKNSEASKEREIDLQRITKSDSEARN
jgi:hypothetical protein